MANVKVFSKVGQTSRSRSQGKKLWYQLKGLVIRNTHVKYESPTSYALKVMTNVKVFVHATDADADADTWATCMTIALRTYVPARSKIDIPFVLFYFNTRMCGGKEL